MHHIHRYAELEGNFYVRTWVGEPGASDTRDMGLITGSLATRPEWLTDIINVAKLSGAFVSPPHPPPDAVLWFYTDAACRLTGFHKE